MNRNQKDHVPGCLRHSSYSPCSLLAAKYGVQPSECVPLVQFVRSSCSHLTFAGLMTIGMPDYSSKPQNFEVLQCMRRYSNCIGLPPQLLRALIYIHQSHAFPLICTLYHNLSFNCRWISRGFLQCLNACKRSVCDHLGLEEGDVELSMGMSNDFEQAVSCHFDLGKPELGPQRIQAGN